MRAGELRIYFGMCAGVGKTYSMLEALHQLKREGKNVVIGYAETHGRKETEALVEGLDLIPLKEYNYRDKNFLEIDLEKILELKPDYVLIDELPHTNTPGMRHPKRWQDVLEIIENGIGVLTALNVQHLETRKLAVEQITGVPIRETVPDAILGKAQFIELIDIAPNELLKRLREGKVYLADKAKAAENNFFKMESLTALREIALRSMAERVDSDLQSMAFEKNGQGWKIQERVLLMIGPGIEAMNLIREGAKYAALLEAKFYVGTVDDFSLLIEEDRLQLSKSMSFAREMGAEVIVSDAPGFFEGLKLLCDRYKITQLLHPYLYSASVWAKIENKWRLLRLLHTLNDVQIHLLKIKGQHNYGLNRFWSIEKSIGWWDYLLPLFTLSLLTAAGFSLLPYTGYRTISYLYLLGVLFVSLRSTLFITVATSLVSVVLWDVLFIPPIGHFHILDYDDMVICFIYLAVALINGYLANRSRVRERIIEKKEKRSRFLYEVVKTLAHGQNVEDAVSQISKSIGEVLNAEVGITFKDETGCLKHFAKGEHWWFNRQKEWSVAEWAFHHGKACGKGTDTLPLAEAIYIPLKSKEESFGVMGIRPLRVEALDADEEDILFTLARQLALFVEKENLQRLALENLRHEESEQLFQTLLNCVSHELRTPIAALKTGLYQLTSELPEQTTLLMPMAESAERLEQVVSNLLDMSRVDSGHMVLKRELCDFYDLISISLEKFREELKHYSFELVVQEKRSLLWVDIQLFDHLFQNLFLNVMRYTPLGTKIILKYEEEDDKAVISFCDTGPGIDDLNKEKVFEKFYRVPGSSPGGTGLGLAIIKAIVSMHGGEIMLKDYAPHGLEVKILVPISKQG